MDIKEILKLLQDDFFHLNKPGNIAMNLNSPANIVQSVEERSLPYPPASKESIVNKQASLGITLPPSYVDFLTASNGFSAISPFLNSLFPIEKIDWAKNVEDQWSLELFNDEPVEVSDDQYFYYGDDQDPVLSRPRYISESLKICEWYNGMCVFLNPLIRFGEEWEVLEYATWFPGIQRYQSFRDYLLKTHKTNQRLLKPNK